MALSIESEGNEVARYLAAKGVTAFVLKYRLAHTGEDATEEFQALYANHAKFMEMRDKIEPQAAADGLASQEALDQGSVRLTRKGRLLADAVIRDLTD